MEGSEELREALMTLRQENDLLRIEKTHAKLLLSALDAVLCVNGDDDPFASVFNALLPVFEGSHAIVLIESDGLSDRLKCIASSTSSHIGSVWKMSRLFERALAGRVATTISENDCSAWPSLRGLDLSRPRPALYMPFGIREQRGLMLLLRDPDQPGFDRAHVSLAKKFSLLASHAFAAIRANQTEAESHRLKQLTEQLEASQKELIHRANHDQLTGLPNRAYIQELVGSIIGRKAPGERLALAFIDLDDFKRVNDLHGHSAGDVLLKEVAGRIRAQIRRTDVVGRISGDEFVIVLSPIGQRSDVADLVARISENLRRPLRVESVEIRPSASIGIAIYPAHGEDYETLRRHADMAMYRAKMSSKGSIAFFDRELERIAADKLKREQRLRHALETRAFRCALQQKVDIRSHAVVGFEVLLRWVDEQGEVHGPGGFLPLANELGLLDDMTFLLLDELLGYLPCLDARYGTALRYSINVSPVQAAKNQFMQNLVQRLLASGRAASFMLELTEETIAATYSFQSEILPLLREAGIGLSIDDFGTGYSSLATIADLTADELKIDRSLITAIHERPRSQAVLRAIESMGTALSLSVVAEGIETIDEKLYLTTHAGVTIAQGYLFHKPELLSELAQPLRAVENE